MTTNPKIHYLDLVSHHVTPWNRMSHDNGCHVFGIDAAKNRWVCRAQVGPRNDDARWSFLEWGRDASHHEIGGMFFIMRSYPGAGCSVNAHAYFLRSACDTFLDPEKICPVCPSFPGCVQSSIREKRAKEPVTGLVKRSQCGKPTVSMIFLGKPLVAHIYVSLP